MASNKEMNMQSILVGALIGGLLGGTAATVFATKTGAKLTENFGEYTDKIRSFIDDINGNITDAVSENTDTISDRAQDIMKYMKHEFKNLPSLDNKDFKKGLIAGAVLGGLLGAGGCAVYNGNCKNLGDVNWKKMANEVLNYCGEKCNVDLHPKSHSIHDMLDFAVNGVKFWKKMSGR